MARNESKFNTEHTNKECNKCHLNSNVEKICSRPALNFKIHLCSITCTTMSEILSHLRSNTHTQMHMNVHTD